MKLKKEQNFPDALPSNCSISHNTLQFLQTQRRLPHGQWNHLGMCQKNIHGIGMPESHRIFPHLVTILGLSSVSPTQSSLGIGCWDHAAVAPQPHQTPHSQGLPLRVCVGLGGHLGLWTILISPSWRGFELSGVRQCLKKCHLLLPAHSPDWLCHLAPEPLNKADPQWSKTEISELQREADLRRPHTKTEPGDGESENKENMEQGGSLGSLGGARPGDSPAEGSASLIHSWKHTQSTCWALL